MSPGAALREGMRRWPERALRAMIGPGRRCRACLEWFEPLSGSGGPLLCAPCAAALAPYQGPSCPTCGLPGKVAVQDGSCGRCLRASPPWRSIGFHGLYEGLLGELIRQCKLQGRMEHFGVLRELAWQAFLRGASSSRVDLVVPVPLHRERLRRRGFNQALEIARPLAARTGLRLAPRALERIRHTVPQMELGADERRRNLTGAFRAERIAAGSRVLLVDDVMTTGSTLIECATVLLRAGVSSVDALVLARA